MFSQQYWTKYLLKLTIFFSQCELNLDRGMDFNIVGMCFFRARTDAARIARVNLWLEEAERKMKVCIFFFGNADRFEEWEQRSKEDGIESRMAYARSCRVRYNRVH